MQRLQGIGGRSSCSHSARRAASAAAPVARHAAAAAARPREVAPARRRCSGTALVRAVSEQQQQQHREGEQPAPLPEPQHKPDEQSPQKPSRAAGPRLPARKASAPQPSRGKSSSSSSGQGGGDEDQQPQERALAGMLAYSGLLGTVAAALAWSCPGVDLFGGWDWHDTGAITLGLELLLPCFLLTGAILWPDYSSWQVPAEPTLEAQQQMAETLLAITARQKAAAAAAKDGGTSTTSAAAAAGGPVSSSSSSSSTQGSSTAGAPAGQAAGPPPMLMPPFAGSSPEPPLPPVLARAKDALLMAQGHYLSAAPIVPLPGPTQAGLLLVNCLAAELLYRSVALQLVGGWISDRLMEAGVEDVLDAVASSASLPVLSTPHAPGQLAAVGLLSAAWVAAVARKVARMSRRPAIVLEAQGRVASGKLLADLEARMAASQARQALPGAGAEQQQQGREQKGNGPAADAAATAAAGSGASTAPPRASGPASPPSPPPPGAPPSWQRQLPATLNALALSQVVTGVRDLSQAAGLGLAFALTGNLAAPFAAAVASEALMLAMQQRGQERVRQRSRAFAKHMASFSRVFRDVQRKQQEQQQQQQHAGVHASDAAAAGSALQHVDAAAAAGGGGGDAAAPLTAAAAAAAAAGVGSSPLEQLVADAAAVDVQLVAAQHQAAAGHQGDLATPGAAAAAASTAAGASTAAAHTSRMERTIDALDSLLGEQLGEHAAASNSK